MIFDFTITLYEWVEVNLENNVKSSTLDTYKRRIETYIIPYFESKPIDSITYDDINNFIFQLKNKPLSPTTIRGIIGLLSSFFENMVLTNKITINPCSKILLPKRKKKRLSYLQVKNKKNLLNFYYQMELQEVT